jgi:phosphomannomutase
MNSTFYELINLKPGNTIMVKKIRIADLIKHGGVKFGTSGARGLAADMTDEVCYAYTMAFIQYLEEIGELTDRTIIAFGGDLRVSTQRIMKAVSKAISKKGYTPENCGSLPSPALAYYGLVNNIPTVMVTGSHIPEDRNGIKYTKKDGEILKYDEENIKRQEVALPDNLFDEKGFFRVEMELIPSNHNAINLYVNRYVEFFPDNCLKGMKIGVYQHSAVGRELMVRILSELVADVIPLGFSNTFIPVDTEAIRPEDVKAASKWSREHDFDAIISTDGDSDRPLISDEKGRWLRGDVAGILCGAYFRADTVATPISCNSAVEKCDLFKTVYRTKIGSPFVVEAMLRAQENGAKCIVGYEANGGFLLGSDIVSNGKTLKALPTRDAIILHLAILLYSIQKNKKISELVAELPQRFTFSKRLKNFPTEKSKSKLNNLYEEDNPKNFQAIESVFSKYFGLVYSLNITDGLRITFESGEVVHLRPSGNAPEFRCYTEAKTEPRAVEMNTICMNIMESWR